MLKENILKIIIYVLVNIAGFYVTPVTPSVAHMLGVFPEFGEEQIASLELMRSWMFGGGIWVWLVFAFISTGYFFVQGKLRFWLLSLPVAVPVLYQIVMLIRFNGLAA